ncbi:MAG: FtsQ-type POTRA domain-containing protein [Oscillospiraceae bacterium]|nr:FtsQ-type POTRA domain-containing protein [Oscillospiraceae bacterium]
MANQRRRQRAAEEARQAQQAQEQKQQQKAEAAKEARRKREERKERSSRAAIEVQRRREERKERTRLDGMRDKQKRQAKHRTRHRISPEAWKRIIIMGCIVVAILLSMIIFFRVRTVEVQGNSYYSDEEVVQAAGIASGDNLLTLSRGEIAGNVIAHLPYVKNVRVTRTLPDTVVITVTEDETTFAVKDAGGKYYLITAAGKAAAQVEEIDAKAHVLIEDLVIQPAVIGESIHVVESEDSSVSPQEQLNALTALLREIEASRLEKEISVVSVPSAFNLTVWYEDRFEVRLGTADDLAYKLEYLKVVVQEQKEYTTGIIDLTFSSGTEAHVMPNEG